MNHPKPSDTELLASIFGKRPIRNPAELIQHRLAIKAKRLQEKEKALKTKTFRMVMERCKKCGEWILRVQKAASRNRWTVLDYAPISSESKGSGRANRGRVMVYKKHHCGR